MYGCAEHILTVVLRLSFFFTQDFWTATQVRLNHHHITAQENICKCHQFDETRRKHKTPCDGSAAWPSITRHHTLHHDNIHNHRGQTKNDLQDDQNNNDDLQPFRMRARHLVLEKLQHILQDLHSGIEQVDSLWNF